MKLFLLGMIFFSAPVFAGLEKAEHFDAPLLKEESAPAPLCDKPVADEGLQKICAAFCVTTYYTLAKGGIGAMASPDTAIANYLTRLNMLAPKPLEADAFVQRSIREAGLANVTKSATLVQEILSLDSRGPRSGLKPLGFVPTV